MISLSYLRRMLFLGFSYASKQHVPFVILGCEDGGNGSKISQL